MTCSQCTSRILRSFVSDLSIPTTHRTSRRAVNRLKPAYISIRYTSSSAPRRSNAPAPSANYNTNDEYVPSVDQVSKEAPKTEPAVGTTDFLDIYNNARKKNSDTEALSTWGSLWKPETKFDSIKGNVKTESKAKPVAFDFLDEWQVNRAEDMNELKDEIYEDEVDVVPPELTKKFPTRSRVEVEAEVSEEARSRADYDIPWENDDQIREKIRTPHDAERNRWRDWPTDKLWKLPKVREDMRRARGGSGGINIVRVEDDKTPPHIRATIYSRYTRDEEKVRIREKTKEEEEANRNKPAWLIHKEAVQEKLGGKAWNPHGRLSPAAVATLKQLKAENPDMTVEEYAPLFKMSPDAMRRILRSKWMPSPVEEKERADRWRRRGDAVWGEWVAKGVVQPKVSKSEKKMRAKTQQTEGLIQSMAKRPKEEDGIMFRQRLNLKNRIL